MNKQSDQQQLDPAASCGCRDEGSRVPVQMLLGVGCNATHPLSCESLPIAATILFLKSSMTIWFNGWLSIAV